MFTTNLKPHDHEYRKRVLKHIKELTQIGYAGFEFPIAPTDNSDYSQEIQDYANLRRFLDDEGFSDVNITTNVGATPSCDPSSFDSEQRQKALAYLKARVDITAELRGKVMMGPIVVPYGAFLQDGNTSIWSDQLQSELVRRYANAQPILQELGEYAADRNVKLAIEPITHWETPGPNKLSQVLEFLDGVSNPQVGVVIDSAHEILDGEGPEIFAAQVRQLADDQRLHYVQVSAPDRGAVHTSWIPWESLFKPILEVYNGPVAIEVFNAIPEFLDSLRLSRRKFWIPGEDPENPYPSAYDIAKEAIDITRQKFTHISSK